MTCDHCDRPATHVARDMQELGTADGNPVWEFVGDWRFGCGEHPPGPSKLMGLAGTEELPASRVMSKGEDDGV